MADGPDNHPDQGFNHPTASVVPISGISRTGLSQAPRTVIATAPGTAGGPPLYAFVSTDRLQPLTALDNHNAAVRHDHVRPGNFPPPAAFTTSPGPSEPNSPAVPSPNIISLPQSPSRIHGPCNPPRRELDTVQKRSSSLPSPVIISQPPTPVQPSTSTQHTPPTNGRRSVKHLTCFWWWTRGRCRYSEDECLYAHHDTGMYTDAPRQLVPGEPARAGRSLERALENLQRQRSSGSLNNLAISRPGTPGLQTTPDHNHRHAQGQPEGQLASLVADKEFLRNQVEKHSMERTILLSSVDSLQNENNGGHNFPVKDIIY